MNRYWEVTGRPSEPAVEVHRPRDLGAIEPLLARYPETPDRFCMQDGAPLYDVATSALHTHRPVRAWTYATRRWIEYDGADLETDFAYEDSGRVRCYRGKKGQDHRYPPLPQQEPGRAFTLLLDPADGEHLPLEILELHVKLRYDELARGARLARGAPDERARWVWDMLEILHRIRTDEPTRILRAFAANHHEFSERGHDPFYVVSDLYAMVRQGSDPWPYLEAAESHFAADELIIPVSGESRHPPSARLGSTGSVSTT